MVTSVYRCNDVTERRARAVTGMSDRIISHMGRNNGNPDLVCENIIYNKNYTEDFRIATLTSLYISFNISFKRQLKITFFASTECCFDKMVFDQMSWMR